MYIQIYNGRIVRVSEKQELENDIQMDLPSNFDYANISLYEVVDGDLIKHEPEIQESIPTQEERIAALEAALLELMGVTVDG